MNLNKKDIIYILVIACLLIGWANAVITQQTAVSYVKGLYNHLALECNRIIGVQDIKDFCVTMPDGKQVCNQNDLNILQSSFG